MRRAVLLALLQLYAARVLAQPTGAQPTGAGNGSAAAPAPAYGPEQQTVAVAVDDAAPLQLLDDAYLSFNLDSGSLFQGIQLVNKQLVALAANLRPAQLRVGGTASDSLWYLPGAPADVTQGPRPDPLAPNYETVDWDNYTGFVPEVTILGDASWTTLCDFAQAAGLSLLMDLNAVDFRDASGAWDPSQNASALLAYTATQGLPVAGWELGNEPDIWSKHFGLSVSGTQLAADLRTLQGELARYGLSTAVTGPSLAGFNASIVQPFLQGWQQSGGGPLSFSAHAYPLGPPTYAPNYTTPSCSQANYFNLGRVNNLATYMQEFSAAVEQYGDVNSTRMVLEETASNSLGGCVGFSDRYISGFYFMNILGVVGEAGWQQINRQDLTGMSFTAAGSQYTLFGPPGWTNGSGLVSDTSPHADYYTAILWKKLMGHRVLTSTVNDDPSGAVAAHVWCAAPTAPGAQSGAVTLAFINTNSGAVGIKVVGTDGKPYALSPRSEFFMTNDNLTDYAVYLNAAPNADLLERAMTRLRVRTDGSLPDTLAKPTGRMVRDSASVLVVPPQSYGFVVLPAAGVAACPYVPAPPLSPFVPLKKTGVGRNPLRRKGKAKGTKAARASPSPRASGPAAAVRRMRLLLHMGMAAALVAAAALVWIRMRAPEDEFQDDYESGGLREVALTSYGATQKSI